MTRPDVPRDPRDAFAEFADIERRFGMDESPLFKVLHALIEQGERLEQHLERDEAKIAFLLSLGQNGKLASRTGTDAIEQVANDDRDTVPAMRVAARRESS